MAKNTPIHDKVVEEAKPVMDENVNPWDVEVDILVPRHRHGEEEFKLVCVNDRRALVKLDGKMHRLPLPIAEAMSVFLAGEDKVEEFKDEIPNETEFNGIPVL